MEDSAESAGGGQELQRAPRGDADDLEVLKDSFASFKTQLSQGHELKKMRREFERHRTSLKKSRQTYADNADILARYDEIVAAQSDIVEGSGRIAASTRTAIERAEDDIAQLQERREALHEQHQQELGPESEELYRRSSELTNANGVVKACKAERDSLRAYARAEDGSSERERYDRAASELALAESRRDEARSRQREAQKAYDIKARGFERAEDELESAAKMKSKEKDKLARELAQLEEKIAAARARIERCEHVRAHPEETEQLASAIEQAEAAEREMSAEIDRLDAEHARSKLASSKARGVLVALGVFVAIIVVVVLVVIFRGW